MITKFKLFENTDNPIKKFTIPRTLLKYQKIPIYDLSTIQDWKTKIISCNSPSEGNKIGDWDSVGYVLTSQNSKHIIPVARADEHHNGYDLLWDLKNKNLIKDINYTSLFYTNNYFYYESKTDKQIKKDLKAVKNYLSYGGFNTNLLVNYINDYYNYDIHIDLKTFIKYNGDISHLEKYIKDFGNLSEEGKDLIDFFKMFSFKLNTYHTKEKNPNEISDYIKWYINDLKIFKNIDFLNILYYKNELIKAANKFNTEKIEQLIYSHNGLKNKIHQMLRQKNKKLKPFFNNIDLALSKMNMISAIK